MSDGLWSSCSISIHALREEGDASQQFLVLLPTISIHALREEGDMGLIPPFCTMSRFLSTPSARRATSVLALRFSVLLYFYPRPPRGGRHYRLVKLAEFEEHFYPRPPRGGRRIDLVCLAVLKGFLSTPSARRATTIKHICSITQLKFLSTPSARRATGS